MRRYISDFDEFKLKIKTFLRELSEDLDTPIWRVEEIDQLLVDLDKLEEE